MRLRSAWIYLRFHLREAIAIVAVGAIILGVLILSYLPYRSPNLGFGSEWECSNPGQVCVKRDAAPENPG